MKLSSMRTNISIGKLFFASISLAIIYQHVAEGAVTQDEYALRLSMKRFVYGGATLQRGQNILAGLEEPLQTADVSDFVIFSWALGNNEVDHLKALLNIESAGLRLVETTILEKDTKKYHLSLRAGQYKTALGTAPKVEWVTYVRTNDNPAPRVLIVGEYTDPLYQCTAGLCTVSDATGLEISFKPGEREPRTLQEEWIKAFDYKFDVTGLISKVYYNGSLINAALSKTIVVHQDLQSSFNSILGSTRPVTSFFLKEDVIFGEIIKDTDLFPQYALSTITEGQGIFSGHIAENTLYFGLDVSSIPNYYISWEIAPEKIPDLEAAIGLVLEDKLAIAPIRMTTNGEKKYILVVNIYSAVGIAPGLRAEWSVFVQRRDKPDSAPYFLVIEASTSAGSLDPADLLTPPAEIFDLTRDGSATSTHLKDGTTEFIATFPLHTEGQCVLSKRSSKRRGKAYKSDRLCDNLAEDFVLANDLIFWSNAVADRVLYNEEVFNTVVGVSSVAKAKIEIKSSQWLPFISTTPNEVIFFFNNSSFMINGWYTLEETAIIPSPQVSYPTNYFEGHQLDFVVDEPTAIGLMPGTGFIPKQLRVLQGDPLAENYYVSWYLASISVDSLDPNVNNQRINRADAFTYCEDEDGKPTLVFIAAIIQTPIEILANPLLFLQFRFEVEKLSGPKDPITGDPAFKHFYVPTFNITSDGFLIVDLDISDPQNPTPTSQTIFSTTMCNEFAIPDAFTNAFILANSQIYKTETDKFVNYFNQDFIAAELTTFPSACIIPSNPEFDLNHFDPTGLGLFDRTNLVSAFSYGDSETAIRWTYELSSAQ